MRATYHVIGQNLSDHSLFKTPTYLSPPALRPSRVAGPVPCERPIAYHVIGQNLSDHSLFKTPTYLSRPVHRPGRAGSVRATYREHPQSDYTQIHVSSQLLQKRPRFRGVCGAPRVLSLVPLAELIGEAARESVPANRVARELGKGALEPAPECVIHKGCRRRRNVIQLACTSSGTDSWRVRRRALRHRVRP